MDKIKVLFDFYTSKRKIIYDGTKVTSVTFEDYCHKYDSGYGAFVETNYFLGIYTDNRRLMLLFGTTALDITDSKIECTNTFLKENRREFVLKIDDKTIYECNYEPLCSDFEKLVFGEKEEDMDFLCDLYLILSSEDSRKNFITGFSLKEEASLSDLIPTPGHSF